MNKYLGIALWIVATAAWMVGFWAQTEIMKKMRDAGYRYWAINPLAMLYGFRTREFIVFVVSSIICVATALVAFALTRDQPHAEKARSSASKSEITHGLFDTRRFPTAPQGEVK